MIKCVKRGNPNQSWTFESASTQEIFVEEIISTPPVEEDQIPHVSTVEQNANVPRSWKRGLFFSFLLILYSFKNVMSDLDLKMQDNFN